MPARILVVDDQEAVRDFTRKILVRAGYEVALAGNGAEALAALGEADFDLVLMDVHMPVMSGEAATRQIRALEGPRSTIPIIAFSGDEQSLVAAGVNDHIDKPFTRAELLAKVDAWLPCEADPPSPADPPDRRPGGTAFQEVCDLMGRPWALRGLAKLQAQIDEAFAEPGSPRDAGQLAGQAHALVSLSAVLGFSTLSEQCSGLEEACRSGHGVQPAFERAKATALEVRAAAVDLIADLKIDAS
ncbi:MAG: response regulator [Rhodospirillales bacterium]|nr:response regulator [Rhodospirillales bacterium]